MLNGIEALNPVCCVIVCRKLASRLSSDSRNGLNDRRRLSSSVKRFSRCLKCWICTQTRYNFSRDVLPVFLQACLCLWCCGAIGWPAGRANGL